MRGKRHHHGGHICGMVGCVGVYGTFRTIPTVESYGAGVFVPARTLIAVKLNSLTAKSVPAGDHTRRPSSEGVGRGGGGNE
jgi:hypothetical protein